MKRDAAQASLPTGDDTEAAHQSKHPSPPSKFRSFGAANLPPNGRGHGITSMCFNMPADGIVDDLKQVICEELSHPRFYLTKRAFRLKLHGNHQPYYFKLSTSRPIFTPTPRMKIVHVSSIDHSMSCLFGFLCVMDLCYQEDTRFLYPISIPAS